MSKEELEKYFFEGIEKYGDFKDMSDFEESTNGGSYIRLALQVAMGNAYNKAIEDAIDEIAWVDRYVNVVSKLETLKIK